MIILAFFTIILFFLQTDAQRVQFTMKVIDSEFYGDYYVRKWDVNNDALKDVVRIAWGAGQLVWYQNPTWEKQIISSNVPKVVWFDTGDVDNDGEEDIIVAFNLTLPTFTSGAISWFRNPGNVTGVWQSFFIGNAPGVHRVLYGKFNGKFGVLSAPIYGKGAQEPYVDLPAVVTLFVQPPSPTYDIWQEIFVTDAFHVLHDLSSPNGEDILVGSLEGLSLLKLNGAPSITNLLSGSPKYPFSPYTGVSSVDTCKVSDPKILGYLASIGPWEGIEQLTPPTIQVHHPFTLPKKLSDLYTPPFNSTTLTVQGPQGHVVKCGDFDGDGNDDFVVGLRGPVKAIYIFQCLDSQGSQFDFYPLDVGKNEGASGIAVHDFNGDGKMDFVACGFPGFGDIKDGDHFVTLYINSV